MLTAEENRLLTRVGPGTPMGALLRRYWVPALLSDELRDPDGDPVRVRLLGEDLVAFRDTNGRVGVVGAYCPHRGAALSYARNEECGLRCIYHGWKFDVDGTAVETPNESGARNWEGKRLLTAYPTQEACGTVWAYMGPADRRPAFPTYEWNVRANTFVRKVLLECNFLQSLEGGIDSSHLSWLHRRGLAADAKHVAIATQDPAPRIELQDMPYGFRYAALRHVEAGSLYVRTTPFIMPWYTIVPFVPDQVQAAHAWVPVDDTHTLAFVFNYTYADDRILTQSTHQYDLADGFRKLRTRDNGHLQDRAAMKVDSWVGIPTVADQDAAVQEGMLPIVDRSAEHIGQADLAVVHMRAMMLAAMNVVEEGREPPGIGMEFPTEQIRCVVESVPVESDWKTLGMPRAAVVGAG